jgi:hypothetical protein
VPAAIGIFARDRSTLVEAHARAAAFLKKYLQ